MYYVLLIACIYNRLMSWPPDAMSSKLSTKTSCLVGGCDIELEEEEVLPSESQIA